MHAYQVCSVPDCKECQYLVENGFVIACDECGVPGASDSDGWAMQPDGLIYCLPCNEKAAAKEGAQDGAK